MAFSNHVAQTTSTHYIVLAELAECGRCHDHVVVGSGRSNGGCSQMGRRMTRPTCSNGLIEASKAA